MKIELKFSSVAIRKNKPAAVKQIFAVKTATEVAEFLNAKSSMLGKYLLLLLARICNACLRVLDTSLIFVLYKVELLRSAFFNGSVFHIVSMGYLWVIYGLSMGYPWAIYGEDKI